MKCKDIVDNVLDYIEGYLNFNLVLKFRSHLRECPECNAFVRTYRKVIKLSKRVKEKVVIPARIKSELEATFLSKVL